MNPLDKTPCPEPGADGPFHIVVALATDRGLERTSNQDCGTSVTPRDPAERTRKGTLVVVADGMGGHEAGEIASRLAVETIRQTYYEHPGAPQHALAAAFAAANRTIYDHARTNPKFRGMGTTATALVIHDATALCAYVGDTRLYLARGGAIYAMTQDHSLVQDLVARRIIGPHEARGHADEHVLLRAIGTHPEVEITMWGRRFPLRAGDRFLLSTDGLHGLVDDDAIRDALRLAAPAGACAELIRLAHARGGHDNITVAVVSVGAAGDSSIAVSP